MSDTISAYPRKSVFSYKYYRVVYQDLNMNYGLDNKPLSVENQDAVRKRIINLLTTSPGEVDFEPDYGCDLPGLLFAPLSDVIAWKMESSLFVAISRWMPEVHVSKKMSSVVADATNNAYIFTIAVSVDGLPNFFNKFSLSAGV